jgi:hypothetical protein|tara:strand:+ start:1407 stop:2135 length:729 start_codon:yes stop_codon:yes gene_type:complete
MKIINKLLFFTLLTPTILWAQSASDNEIRIDQAGDTLNLTIDQIGYGNKLCGTLTSGVCGSDMVLTGSSVTMNIDMIGNLNAIYGPVLADSTEFSLNFTGSSNVWDWTVGASGSADSSNLLTNLTGSSNTMNLDWGSAQSSERLDFDLDVTGSSNVFATVIEVDDAIYDVDVIGSSNDINTSMTDGAYHKIDLELIQSNGNIDIVQSSGTCPTGITSCHSEIIAEFDSENATINIIQKDTAD